ncbi:MAG: LD-carboxypeptidase [Bacteroidales bacterium]|nr:LD-carboxypeptidase [Bacteroidales bacterium]
MTTPGYLKKGDSIAIVAPAGKISKEKINAAVKIFESWGLKVVLGKHLFHAYHQFSATDQERAADFQCMLDDKSVKAIICARGGYGVVRIIDRLDFSVFVKNPKWIVGFSDITIFFSHILTNYGIETLHAIMPLNFPDSDKENESLLTLRKALFGEPLNYTFSSFPLSRKGEGEGVLTGGNLSILCSLIGTKSDINTDNKILFIEDVSEYLYRLDRMMWQMKRAGKLESLAGLIVGRMTEMKDNEIPFGKNAYEIIAEAVKEYNYPVCYGFPAGHTDDNRALILGRKIKLTVNDDITTIT